MKLNLHILKEDLKQWHFQGILVDKPTQRYCTWPLLCHELPFTFKKNILYIVHAEILPSAISESLIEECPSILCIGFPPEKWLHCSCNFLYSESEISEIELINTVNYLFSFYQNWEDQLQDVLDKQLSFQELALRSSDVIQNGIYAQGAFFRILCIHLPPVKEETEFYKYYKESFANFVVPNSILNAEDINILVSDSEYNEAINVTEPTIYSGVQYGFRTLFYNISVENTFVARVCFDEIIKPFTDKDFALIQIFGSYMQKKLLNSPVYFFNHSQEIDRILYGLLNHRLLPEKDILSLLQTFQWNVFDSYICMVLKLNAENTTAALEPLALQLSQMIINECYTIKENSVIFVCNLTQLGTTRDQLYSKILPFLRDNLLSAGISTTYDDFKNLYYYYQQAIIAETIGQKINPTHWYFKFEEYQLEYMLQKCTESTIPEVLIPEGLKALIRYDQQKGHDYAETLRIYLDHDRNIADTIRAAYMHRNTFLYRIQRIQEILKMDLEDPDTRLILQIAFRILDRQNITTAK